MGSQVSMSRMDNRSQYTVHHTANGRNLGPLFPGRDHHFNDEFNWVTHTLSVYDTKHRLIKKLEFRSNQDNQWEIQSWGCRLVRRWDHSNGTGSHGSTIHWQLDDEARYKEEDRREEERRRQEEQRRRQEEERRRREEERRRQEEERRRQEEERRRKQEEERRRQEEEKRRREEAERKRQEEERRRQEEERRRQEEERRRKEEEERQRKANVDQERTSQISKERYEQEMEESTGKNAEIGRQMEQRMIKQSLEQQRTIGWSTADKVEIKGKLGDMNIQPEENRASEDDEQRIQKFLWSYHRISKEEDKQAATLKAIKLLRPTDFVRFPDKILLSIYRRLLEIPRDDLHSEDDDDDDGFQISEVILSLMEELGVKAYTNSRNDNDVVAIGILKRLPPLPSSDGGDIDEQTVFQALEVFSKEMASLPLDTFTIYAEKLYQFKTVPEELLQTVTKIVDSQPVLISSKLANWALELKVKNGPLLSVILEKSLIKTEKMLRYLESFPKDISVEQCIAYLCSYVDGDFNLEPRLLPKYLQLLKDKGKYAKILQHLLLLTEAIIVGKFWEVTPEQKQSLEGALSTVLSNASDDDKPLILKFAGNWYLLDKIGFTDYLSNGMMNLLKEGDRDCVTAVSEFFEDVADKDIRVLDKLITITSVQLQMDRKKELGLKTKLMILDARLKSKINVSNPVINAIIASFNGADGATPPNLSYDSESIYYSLRILLKAIPTTKSDFPAEYVFPYLDHVEASIRIVAFSVLTLMMELGRIKQQGNNMMSQFNKFGRATFQNWETVENHQDSVRFMKIAIKNMETEGGNEEEWKELSKDIPDFCLPSVSSGSKEIVQGSLEIFERLVDKLVTAGQLDEKYLEKMCEDIHPRLLQKLLTHLLSLKGHSLYPACVTKLAKNIKGLKRFDERELQDMASFLKDDGADAGLKEKLVMSVLAIQLEKCLPILSVIEHVVEYGNPEVVKVYAEAVSKLAVKYKLRETTMEKLFHMLDDPRFKISIRKSVAKSMFYILRLEKEILGRNENFLESLVKILKDASLRVYGLFALCHVASMLEPRKGAILAVLHDIHGRFVKMKGVALDEISSEEDMNFKLSRFLLGRFGNLEESDEDLQFNWMTEWTTLNKDDNLSYMFSDQSKHARWLLKQEDPTLVQQGQRLSLELGISKADILLRSGKISQAESVVDKTLKFGKSPKLLLLKADVFMAKSSFKGAFKQFRDAEIINAEIAFKVSRALMALGKYSKAAEILSENTQCERDICTKSQELHNMLVSQTGSLSVSQRQLKSFHAKTSQSFSHKEILQLLNFLIEQNEYFDLSVILALPPKNWRIEFIAREIFVRSRNKSGSSWATFYYEFLEIQKLYKDSQLMSILSRILELERGKGVEVGFNLIIELLFLIKAIHEYDDTINVLHCMEDSRSVREVLRELHYFWIRKKFSLNVTNNAEIESFFTACESARKVYPQLSLPFLNVLLDSTKSSNSLQEIADYLIFCKKEKVTFPEIQEFVGELRLQLQLNDDEGKGTDAAAGVNLRQYRKDYLKERLIKDILEILKQAKLEEDEDEEIGMVIGELISHYEDKICGAEEVKEFVQFLGHLDKQNRTDVIQAFSTALSVDKAYKNVDIRPKIVKLVKKAFIDGGVASSNWKKDIREICMAELLHSVGEEKDMHELAKEYIQTNDEHFGKAFSNLTFFAWTVSSSMKSPSIIGLHPGQPIDTWDGDKIKKWANTVKLKMATENAEKDNEQLKIECFAVIQRAMDIFKGYRLRQVGVMSLYILLSSKECGCLAKIATGEGKSGLVAALAVYKCLQGHTVDVITNSSVLAQRDHADWEGYFNMFGFTAMENSGLQEKPNQAKACYLQNIVYGDTSAFQGDVLRHEFSLLGTRGSRQFDTVIVDEVDSMFIDGSNHSTRLIDKMPQMDYVEPLFAAIWQLVGTISATIVGIEDKTFAIRTDMCGNSNDLLGCVVKAVAAEKITLDKPCSSDAAVKQALSLFAAEMQKEELADTKFRRQVVNLLKQKDLWDSLPKQVGQKVREMDLKQLGTDSEIVDMYIREKWVLSDMVTLRNVLELYLKINILVYENIGNSLQLSKLFHSEEEAEDNGKLPTLRFFKGEADLFLLTFVENDTLYISRTVETAVRKQFATSFRSVRYTSPDLQKASVPQAVEKDPKLPFPGHIFELFNTKLDEWINSAIQAMFAMEENRNYVIKPGGGKDGKTNTITPVDFQNTGVTQESSVWGDGLHQFLQMKHKLKISPEYLATNFISNMSFFQRYKSNIYGLTGTLGDSNEVDLLKQLYKVQTINVPTFKPKRLLELGSVVAYDAAQWKNEILNSAAWEIGAGRVVLIICRTIEDVNSVQQYLGEKLKQACGFEDQDIDFRLYYRSDDAESEASIGGKMRNGTVVIATNLAGRGTNIKLNDEVIASGGLHVIISFLPTNVRVEEQAAGRAARNGEPGTSQIILNLENETNFIPPSGEPSILAMKEERAQVEKARVDKIRDKLASELVIEERQFVKFCDVKAHIQKGRKVNKNKPDYILKGVGERWAVQLEIAKTKNDVVNWEKVDRDFNGFFANLKNEYEADIAIQNPSYFILQGNLHLMSDKNERSSAIDMYSRAIQRDKVFVQHAFYNRAHAIINQAGDDYKDKATVDLIEAGNLINGQILPMLSTMHAMVDSKELKRAPPKEGGDEVDSFATYKAVDEDNDFTKQMIQKINFNYLQVKSINEAIEKIQNSKRDVVAKFGDIKEFYAKNDTEIDYADIEEMEDNGFVRFMYVEEKPFPWWDVIAVFILGALQMVAGACLCLIGAVNIGGGLIAEGVSDIVTGVTACITGEFSWTDYLKNKALSIGVSLLFAGAGLALKAISSLPKVVSIVKSVTTAVKSSVFVTKAVTAAKFVWNGVKTIGSKLWQGAKAGGNAVWNGIKTGAKFIYTKFINSAPIQFITKSKPWIYAKNALSKAYNYVKDGVKYVWNKGKELQSKIFGSKNLDPKTYSNLKTAGQLIGREILSTALFAGLEHTVLEAIGNAVEEQIRADVEDHLKKALDIKTERGKKCRKVLASCMGKKNDVQIANGMMKGLEGEESEFWEQLYKQCIVATVGKLLDLLKGEKGKNAKGWAAFGMHLVDHLISVVKRSVAIAEAIKSLHQAMPLAIKHLEDLLNDLEETVKKHDHAAECKGKDTPVDQRDMERVISSYCSTWSAKLAKKMRGLIMSNLVQPHIQISYDKMYKTLTKGGEFDEFLTSKAHVNKARIVARKPGLAKWFRAFDLPVADPFTPGKRKSSPKPKQPAGDNDPPPQTESFGESKSTTRPRPSIPAGDNDLPAIAEREAPKSSPKPKMARGDSDIPVPEISDILRFSSKSLNAAIDVYLESEGGLRYKETIGSSQNKDGVSLKIVAKTSEDGIQSFSRLTTGNSSNELQLMEFAVADEKSSLYSALTCESNVFETRESFESQIVEFTNTLQPRPLKYYPR